HHTCIRPYLDTSCFFFNVTPTPDTSTLSLHDALPICHLGDPAVDDLEHLHRPRGIALAGLARLVLAEGGRAVRGHGRDHPRALADRKSTRLNSSHGSISYAVFCLKNKNEPKPVKQEAN